MLITGVETLWKIEQRFNVNARPNAITTENKAVKLNGRLKNYEESLT